MTRTDTLRHLLVISGYCNDINIYIYIYIVCDSLFVSVKKRKERQRKRVGHRNKDREIDH